VARDELQVRMHAAADVPCARCTHHRMDHHITSHHITSHHITFTHGHGPALLAARAVRLRDQALGRGCSVRARSGRGVSASIMSRSRLRACAGSS
jgi:hypothetical protein